MSEENVNALLAELNRRMDRCLDKEEAGEYTAGMYQGLALATHLIRRRLDKDHPAAIS